jgi:hypothetical protein
MFPLGSASALPLPVAAAPCLAYPAQHWLTLLLGVLCRLLLLCTRCSPLLACTLSHTLPPTLLTQGLHATPQVAMPSVEEYIAKHDVWVSKAALPEARFRFAATAVGEQVYVFGGHPTCGQVDTPSELCFRNGLRSVYSFVDVAHPDVYVMVKS